MIADPISKGHHSDVLIYLLTLSVIQRSISICHPEHGEGSEYIHVYIHHGVPEILCFALDDNGG